jgi:ribA/ribD-fused uncharacterized protein
MNDESGVVTEFRGEYAFLSNFYPGDFEWRGVTFLTGEHAFSYAKAFSARSHQFVDEYQTKVLNAPTPSKAKYEGRSMLIDLPRWNAMKVGMMREIVHARFTQDLSGENMCDRLLNTGAKMLVEGNDWNDTFWGRCNGKGQNTLGVILMEERGYLLRSNT